jgi:hypothetical protein
MVQTWIKVRICGFFLRLLSAMRIDPPPADVPLNVLTFNNQGMSSPCSHCIGSAICMPESESCGNLHIPAEERPLTPPPCGQPDSLTLTSVTYGQEAFSATIDRLVAILGPYTRPTPPPVSLDLVPPPSPVLTSTCPVLSCSPTFSPSLPTNERVLTLSAVFIGFRRDDTRLRRSCLERDLQLEDTPSIGIILSQLIARHPSQASRILSRWPIDRQTWVFTSSIPHDIEGERYNHYSANFTNIGTLSTILDAPDQSPPISSATPSSVLDTFLENRSIPKQQPVYVIYVCMEVCCSHLQSTDIR